MTVEQFNRLLTGEILERVTKPGQYLGNEWGAAHRSWESAAVHLALAFPDLYELGMSNFGLRILYEIVNSNPLSMADRAYATDKDMEEQMRAHDLPLWGWESRRPLHDFELIGFSLQYELTYTNVLNMLDLAQVPVASRDRRELFPLVYAGGPGAMNPEPMSQFMDFFMIGDGEETLPKVLELVAEFKKQASQDEPEIERSRLLALLAERIPGIYVPALYRQTGAGAVAEPVESAGPMIPRQVKRQVVPLTDLNQPVGGIVPYLSLVHDREVLEVRRGCDRGCRFCQSGYTYLPVRERSVASLLRLSREALDKSGHQEFSLLSLSASDYTALSDAVGALNAEHSARHVSMSFPSQRADRMNLDLAGQLKIVRKSGITLAPEAGTERMRAVINKGLTHDSIVSAIEAAYQSGWCSIKLYFMIGLPTETDEDLDGIVKLVKEATERCDRIKRSRPARYKRRVEFTCTISNFVPKPFTPFQWFAQVAPAEFERRHAILRNKLQDSGLRHVTFNFTSPQITILESALARGDRSSGELIYRAWRLGACFDAWDDRCRIDIWRAAAKEIGMSLEEAACRERTVGEAQPWNIVQAGVDNRWLAAEWEKAIAAQLTAPCTEGSCHACGVCTALQSSHQLCVPKPEALATNPFIKEIPLCQCPELTVPEACQKERYSQPDRAVVRIRFEFTKCGEMRMISHLDLQHLLARAARRAGLPVAFTAGFNPQPRLSLAVPLPLFQEGLAELGEVDLTEPWTAEEMTTRMNQQLPPEIRIVRSRPVALNGPSLASLVGRAVYLARRTSGPGRALSQAPDSFIAPCVPAEGASSESPATEDRPSRSSECEAHGEAIKIWVEELLSQPKLEISSPESSGTTKKAARPGGHDRQAAETKDIRPGIFSICLEQGDPVTLKLEVAAGPKMHIKPTEVLKLIHPDLSWRVTRVGLATPEGIPLFDIS